MKRSIISIIFILLIPVLTDAADPFAYVLNTNSETLSKINLGTNVVSNNILTVGSDVYCYPNQIVIRDSLAYVVLSGTDEIQKINLNSETTINFINLELSSNPYWIDFIDEQYLLVTLMLTNQVARVNYLTGTTVGYTEVGKSPAGITIIGDKAYIACSGFDWGTYQYDAGRVAVYDIVGDSLRGYIDVDLNPQYMALDRLGRLHVVCTGDYFSVFGKVNIIDVATDSVIEIIDVGGTPGQISIGPENIAYIAAAGFSMEGYVYSYHALDGTVYHDDGNPIEVDLNCLTVAAYQDSTCLTGSFTNYVNRIDSAGSYLYSYAVGDGPIHVAFNYMPGDIDGDFAVNLFDITYMIKWLYQGGSEPPQPLWRANVNADRLYNVFDITYLIAYLYKGGPGLKVGPVWLM